MSATGRELTNQNNMNSLENTDLLSTIRSPLNCIVDNAIESINNTNRLLANAAHIRNLEREIAELKAKLRSIEIEEGNI